MKLLDHSAGDEVADVSETIANPFTGDTGTGG